MYSNVSLISDVLCFSVISRKSIIRYYICLLLISSDLVRVFAKCRIDNMYIYTYYWFSRGHEKIKASRNQRNVTIAAYYWPRATSSEFLTSGDKIICIYIYILLSFPSAQKNTWKAKNRKHTKNLGKSWYFSPWGAPLDGPMPPRPHAPSHYTPTPKGVRGNL